MAKKPTLYVLFCDRVFDQVCEGLENAKREKDDLTKMGFNVTMKLAADWKDAEKMELMNRG